MNSLALSHKWHYLAKSEDYWRLQKAWRYWPCTCTIWCHTENVIDCARAHGYPLKLRLGLIMVPAHSPNFWTHLYDILGSSIMSSKNAHLGWFLRWHAFV